MIERAFPALSLDPVALLVDGENLSLDLADALLVEACRFGVPTVRRVYGNAGALARWHLAGFRPVQTHPGKNSADMLLCVEAMHFALRDAFHTIIIASSDRDFLYVQTHLRELGHCVIGMGEPKTPPEFRAACSAFVELVRVKVVVAASLATGVPLGGADPTVDGTQGLRPGPSKGVPSTDTLRSWLRQRLHEPDAAGGLGLALLGHAMRKEHPRHTNGGHGTLQKLLRSMPQDFVLSSAGTTLSVRLVALPAGKHDQPPIPPCPPL